MPLPDDMDDYEWAWEIMPDWWMGQLKEPDNTSNGLSWEYWDGERWCPLDENRPDKDIAARREEHANLN
jgi:hypothetical protein